MMWKKRLRSKLKWSRDLSRSEEFLPRESLIVHGFINSDASTHTTYIIRLWRPAHVHSAHRDDEQALSGKTLPEEALTQE
jgi:hypothetical protein